MKGKKLVSLLLTAVTVVSLLAGCGTKEVAPSSNDSTEQSDSSESSDPVELEEKTIQIWLHGDKQKDSEKVWAAFNEKLKEYVPNTTVEFTLIAPAEYKEKFQQMLASGEGVDIAYAANWVTGNISEDINDGNFMPLNDLLAEYGQGINEVLGENVQNLHKKADGELYYLVNWQGLGDCKYGYYFVKEIADLAGDTWADDTAAALDKYWNEGGTVEDYQKVFDQFDKYLAAAKEAGMLGAGMKWGTDTSYATHLAMASGSIVNVGLDHRNADFEVVDGFQSEYYKVYCKNMADFYKKGYIRSDAMSVDTSSLHQPENGVIDENTYIMDKQNNWGDNRSAELTAQWGMDAICIGVERNSTLNLGEATINVIPYCADEPERAMMVMNALYTEPELYQLLVYGIEGEHYTDNGDGTVNRLGGTTSEDSYGYDNWKVGSCINSLVTQNDTPGFYEMRKEEDTTAYSCPFTQFVFDQTGLEDVITAVRTVQNDYNAQMQTGCHGDDWEKVYEEFMAERKAAGIDKVIDAMKEQMSKYIEERNITSW